jgi:hypothetical protein
MLSLAPLLAAPARAADDALLAAVQAGDVSAVQRALVAGADPSAVLKAAVATGSEPVVRLLLANGATDDPAQLLIEAIGARSLPLATLFLAKTGSVNVKLPDGTTALHRAAQKGDPTVLKWLIVKGASVDARREDGITALADASWYGNNDVISLLVASGADPNVATLAEHKTPLHFAAERGSDRTVEHLLALGAASSAPMSNGWTPFRLALDRGKPYSALLCHDHELEREHVKQRVGTVRIDPQSTRPVRFAPKNFAVPRTGWSRFFTERASGVPSIAWSSLPSTDDEPLIFSGEGARRFFGPFGRQSVRLSLKGLPAHKAVSVRFTLLILDSWDGSRYGTGPDRWILDVLGGPWLLETTFCNNDEDSDSTRLPLQAFPGTYLFNFNPSRTASLSNNHLSEPRDWNHDGKPFARDANYDIEVVFPHTKNQLTLDFTGAASQETNDESWGLETVKVSVAR